VAQIIEGTADEVVEKVVTIIKEKGGIA